MLPSTNLRAVYGVAPTDLLPLAAAPMTAINKSLRQPRKIIQRSIDMVVY
ncbi:MAG: hypothetical protein ACJ04O_08455 [Cellvibrionales bacterium]